MMIGQYGMFSQSNAASPHGAKTSSAKPKQASKDGRGAHGSKDKSHRKREGAGEEREKSPLFEPEDGYKETNFATETEDVTMSALSPTPVIDTLVKRKRRGKCATILRQSSRHKRPIPIKSSDSYLEVTIPEPRLTQQQGLTPEKLQGMYEASPLPGNASLVDEHMRVIEALCALSSQDSEHTTTIQVCDKEDTDLLKHLAGLCTEESQRLAVIAQDLAYSIEADIKFLTTSANLSCYQTALEKRHAEAAEARHALSLLMAKKKMELEMKRGEVKAKRDAAVEAQEEAVKGQLEELKKRKVELEVEGGMAMAYELGRRVERMIGSETRSSHP
jgi:hypothetical protein